MFLVQHDDRWDEYYKEIEAEITELFEGCPVKRIGHIGSTAIKDIWEKKTDFTQ
ncbi:GrpB family protein [Lachnobacterium bovis]|uniref:GrpB family protein n=1 Tax=Lachnobacterium bovis TaxID=140626 RepID=UPI0038B85FC0